jgi:hypothetical protein
MQRDQRKNSTYFENLLPQYIEGLENLHLALEDGSMPLPDEQTHVANDLFELQLMYAIASYSSGESIETIKPKVEEILASRKLFIQKVNSIPPRQQVYREQFETIFGDDEINGVYPITRYINSLWWLSLAIATQQSKEHCLEILECIGNRGKDAFLDKIAIFLGDKNTAQAPSLYYPHLYRALFNSFYETPSQRKSLLKSFMDDWYSSCWQSAWYNNASKEDEEEGNWDFYFGYWSFEALLIVNLLQIDDTDIKKNPYYPADLSILKYC